MSSIFGVVHLGGAPVDPEALQLMSRGLEYRQEGPVQTGIWGNIGLGMRSQKAHSATQGSPVFLGLTAPLVADARLDNRQELCAELSLDAESSTAAEIVAKAYGVWGERCTDHLIGDFAFAVFDKSRNCLFCARDHFGVRPFYYTRTADNFAFATDPRGITALDKTPRPFCDSAVLDYLLVHWPDREKFFLDGILKLPPAHQLLLEGARLSTRKYWELQPDKTAWNMEPTEAARRFRVLFRQAVDCRIGARNRTATFLSGGLDSSSVTAQAVMAVRARGDDRPIQSFASVFPDVPESDETKWIRQVVDFLNRDGETVDLHVSDGKGAGPLRDMVEMTASLGEPVLAPNQYMTWDMVRQTAGTDVDVILTGHDGDTVVGHAMYQLTNLALERRFDALDAEMEVFVGTLKDYKGARSRLLISHVSPAVGIAFRKLQFFRAYGLMQALHRRYKMSRKIMLRQCVPHAVDAVITSFARRPADSTFLKDGLSMRWRVFRRRLANGARWESRPVMQHISSLQLSAISATFESFDRIGASHGIELRHPFFDKRLVEFCVSLPPSAKIRDNVTRWVLRAAMAGVLPEDVRLRRTKADLSPSFGARLAKDSERLDKVLRRSEADEAGYLDEAALARSVRQLRGAREMLSVRVYAALCMDVYMGIHTGRIPAGTLRDGRSKP